MNNNNETVQQIPVSSRILKAASDYAMMGGCRNLRAVCFYCTEFCNLNCKWCNASHRAKNQIDPKRAYRFFAEARDVGLRAVNFSGGGEPTCHPEIVAMMWQALHMGLKVSLVTNGTRLDTLPMELLSRLTWIRVSINSGQKKYKEIHGRDEYEKVIKNVHLLSDLKHVRRSVNFVWSVYVDLEDVESLRRDLEGANLAELRIAVDRFTLGGPVLRVIPPEIYELADGDPKITCDAARMIEVPKTCHTQWHKPVVDADGMIYPCVLNRRPMCKMEQVLDYWQGGEDEVDTSKCKWCHYGDLNWFISGVDISRQSPDAFFL